ncbi:MAG: nitroreductase family protein [Thermoguttaceae bacterium]
MTHIIDQQSCVRCGQCIITCPRGIFFRTNNQSTPEIKENGGCIGCYHCVVSCPVGAISVNSVNTALCPSIPKESVPRFEHIATLARMRRSVRNYAEKSVEPRLLVQLLDVIRWTPTARNMLPIKWIVVNEKEKMKELSDLVMNWITTLPKTEEMVDAWKNGKDPIFHNAPVLVVAYTDETAIWPEIDATIAITTLDYCATAKRLGTCWAGFFIRAAQKDPAVKKLLGLDATQTVQAALMIGYIGQEAYQKIPHRPELDIRWI